MPGNYDITSEETLHQPASARSISISSLQQLVAKRARKGSPLREALVADKSVLTAAEILSRIPVWLKLADLEIEGS